MLSGEAVITFAQGERRANLNRVSVVGASFAAWQPWQTVWVGTTTGPAAPT